MQSEIEQARHARERGDILRTLKEDYTNEMTSTRSLLGALDAQGMSLSEDALDFHLVDLELAGYVRIWRMRDTAGYRSDRHGPRWRKPDSIMFCRLLTKGLRLIDGLIEADPGVVF